MPSLPSAPACLPAPGGPTCAVIALKCPHMCVSSLLSPDARHRAAADGVCASRRPLAPRPPDLSFPRCSPCCPFSLPRLPLALALAPRTRLCLPPFSPLGPRPPSRHRPNTAPSPSSTSTKLVSTPGTRPTSSSPVRPSFHGCRPVRSDPKEGTSERAGGSAADSACHPQTETSVVPLTPTSLRARTRGCHPPVPRQEPLLLDRGRQGHRRGRPHLCRASCRLPALSLDVHVRARHLRHELISPSLGFPLSLSYSPMFSPST